MMGGGGEIRVDVGALNDASSPRVGDDAGAGLGLIAAEPGAVGGVEPGDVGGDAAEPWAVDGVWEGV